MTIQRRYESYLIIDGNLDDTAIDEVIKKFESLLIKNGCEIDKTDRIGRRRLAYPIKRRQNGFYVCFEFHSEPSVISKIERPYKFDENVLRYLNISVSSKTLKEKDEHFKNKALLMSSESLKPADTPEVLIDTKPEDDIKEIVSEDISQVIEK